MRKLFLFLCAVCTISLAAQQHAFFSEGDWYHFSTDFSQPSQNAIKLTYEKLSNSGIDLQEVNPDKIKLLMMPPGLMEQTVDYSAGYSVKEMAVKMYGCDDGSFDPGDYLLFYPVSQKQWSYNNDKSFYTATIHPYDETVNYFLRTDAPDDGKRIEDVSAVEEDEQQIITSTDKLTGGPAFGGVTVSNMGADFVEQEITEEAYTYEIGQMQEAALVFSVVWIGTEEAHVEVAHNGLPLDFVTLPASGSYTFGRQYFATGEISFQTGDVLTFSYQGDEENPEAKAFLDDLSLQGSQSIPETGLFFSAAQQLQEVVQWQGPWNNNTEVWDVTDVLNVKNQLKDADSYITTQSDQRQRFVAFDVAGGAGVHNFEGLLTPLSGTDLYAQETPEMYIITNGELADKAQELANRHIQQGLSASVVEVADIYQNFSGGVVDFTALRNFLAHHYQQSDNLKYVTLFGDASVYHYDERFIVPAFQSAGEWNKTRMKGSDLYFGFLDDGEHFTMPEADMDIAVGRIPVATVDEAADYLAKAADYNRQGEWKTGVVLIADDEDGNVHMDIQEQLASEVFRQVPLMNIRKIYLDAYPQVNDEGAQSYPQARSAISQAFEEGALFMDYMGHAGHGGWAAEAVLDQSLIDELENNTFPLVLATTKLDFFHADSPSIYEEMILAEGGAIAAIGSSGVSFATPWNAFKGTFHDAVFVEGLQTPGEAFRYAVNENYGTMMHNYTLLGDPALQFPFPEYEVLTETINETDIAIFEDTLQISDQFAVAGGVYDNNGVVHDFQGEVLVQAFAPPHQVATLGNDGEAFTYTVADSLMHQQVAEVNDGRFEAIIALPESYDFAPGNIKLSYYAYSGQDDAAGYEDTIFALAEESAVPEQEQLIFKAYPTVTDDKVFVRVASQQHQKVMVELFNLHGKCLVRNRLSGNGEKIYSLSLSSYPGGMYFLHLSAGKFRETIKIIRE